MNPLKGEVPLTLPDGREFVLVLDHEAMIEAEQLYRKPIEFVIADMLVGFHGAWRAVLYGMLRANHPEVTPREALTLFEENKDAVAEAFERAREVSKPEPGEEGKEGARPPAGGGRRGTSSGSNGAERGSSRKRSSAPPRGRTKSRSEPA